MLNFTQEELKAVLFVFTLALLGLGADFLAKLYLPVKSLSAFNQELGKINLNQADKDLLKTVPGIGEKLAGRIIEYRKKETGFSRLEELKQVKGVSDAK
ncbi:MAG: helix-hairpin-helix domain-containing protein [Candidatus Omnitrophica bacterium]|nr:helix-hairpin-helix domain-containing protein [Candidatus Omnitrophota bacterium]